MTRKHPSLMAVAAGSIVVAFYGCADDSTNETNDELESAELTIAALRASGQVAQAAAAACFDTFKTCEASAAAGDTTCREQLKACLPDRAPAAPGCDDGGDASARDAGSRGDAGARVPGLSGDRERGSDASVRADASVRKDRGPGAPGDDGDVRGSGGDRSELLADGGKPECDGGVFPFGPSQGSGRDQDRGGGDERGRDQRGGGVCGHQGGFPHGAVGGCRDSAGTAVQGGMSMDGARAAHQACVVNAFDDRLAKLCTKATALCAQAGAPADVCTRINSACSTLSQGDAGI